MYIIARSLVSNADEVARDLITLSTVAKKEWKKSYYCYFCILLFLDWYRIILQ